MASGLGLVRHHRHGKTVIEDMVVHKIGDRLALTVIPEVVMTDADLPMNTGLHHLLHLESEDPIGATAQMHVMATSLHSLLTADTHYHLFLAMALMAVTGAEALCLLEIRTFRATVMKDRDDHVNPMIGLAGAREIPAILGMDTQTTVQTEAGRTGIGTESETEQGILGTLPGIGETEEHGRGVRRGGTGTVIGTMTFIGGGEELMAVR